jgi:hypothetical protein
MGMGVTEVYLLVVVPLLAVATAAVWVPRPWQLVLLYAGPLLTVLAAVHVPGVDRLGFLLVYGTPYLLLLVLPVLPWRRPWARWAVPVTVLVVAGLLAAVGGLSTPILFFVAYPVVLALGALVVMAVSRRRRQAPEGVVGGAAKP